MDNSEKGLGGIGIVLVVVIIWMWSNMNTLKDKVSACAWQIETANISIGYANDEIKNAKNKAGLDYPTMDYTLRNLSGDYAFRENPCDKDFSGDLSNYPKQE